MVISYDQHAFDGCLNEVEIELWRLILKCHNSIQFEGLAPSTALYMWMKHDFGEGFEMCRKLQHKCLYNAQ